MKTAKIVGCLALVLAACNVAAARGAGRGEHGSAMLAVYPRVATAGSGVRVVVRTPPAAENRRLRVSVESGTYSRSSEIDLEGTDAAETYWFDLRGLPAGEYTVEATVFGTSGARARAMQFLTRQ